MPGEPLVVILVLVFGCAAFIFGVIYMAARALAWFGTGLFGFVKPATRSKRGHVSGGAIQPRVCRRELCRRVEHRPEAKYCCQCGASLCS